MNVTCNPETYPAAASTCGRTYNDLQRSTVCPHPLLSDPDGPGLPPPEDYVPASGPVEEPETEPGLFADADRVPCPMMICAPPDDDAEPVLYHRLGMARHLALEHDTTIAHVEAEQLALTKPQADAGPDLEPPPIPEGNAARARYLLDHVLWAADRGVELDASGLAARAQVYATLAVADALSGGEHDHALEGTVCGAEAVLEWFEGHPRQIRWCGRRQGPCPFEGATTLAHYRREIEAPLEHLRDCAVEREVGTNG